MFVCSDDAGDLAASDAFVGDCDPHVVACQHDLSQLRGFVSHLNIDLGHLGTVELAVVHLKVYRHRIFVFLEGILDHCARGVRTHLPP